MKALTTNGLTKLIQLIKSSFIAKTDTVTTNIVTLATVATTGDYDDLINQPTIPTNNNQLTNGAGYITVSALNGYATENFVTSQGYITGITSSDVTTALGYTPYNSANPNGYITSSALNSYVTNSTLTTTLADYQPLLVSGTNIKTVNNTNLLGSGNIDTSEIFVAEYNVTTYQEVLDAYNAGKIIYVKYRVNTDDKYYQLLSYDYLHLNIFKFNRVELDGSLSIPKNTVEYITLGTTGWTAPILYTLADATDLDGKADTDLLNLSTTGQAVINGKVSKSGDTMTGDLNIQYSDVDLSTNPSTSIYHGVELQDTNGNRIGRFEGFKSTAGNYGTTLSAKKLGENSYVSILCGYDSNGNAYTQAPTPSDNDNSTKIATTAFVKKACDGQWVQKNVDSFADQINLANSSNTAWSKSVSSYLPDDSRVYEILVSGNVVTGNTSGNYASLEIWSDICSLVKVCRVQTRTSSTAQAAGAVWLPVGSGRTIYVRRASGWVGEFTIDLRGYRRVGINN